MRTRRSSWWRSSRRRRSRWRRWAEGIDPWMPRPADYVVASLVFLGLALLHVGARSYAVQLQREVFRLEERLASLRDGNDVLAARANTLVNRARIVTLAREELGMVVPKPDAFVLVYYVPENDAPPLRGPLLVPAAPVWTSARAR